MLDDRDEFSNANIKADMELASFKGYAEDIFLDRVCLPGMSIMGRLRFIGWQLKVHAVSLDKALDLMIWNKI